MRTKTKELFFELVRAGLWADADANLNDCSAQRDACLSKNQNDKAEWEKVYQLAEEQSVIGLVLAGLEKTNTNRPPQELLLQWIGEVQILEQQNKAMNQFIAELIERLRKADIYTLLIKGQGVARCYERPLWRACGDVDLLLSADNYEKAKTFLTKFAYHVDPEDKKRKHLGMTILETFGTSDPLGDDRKRLQEGRVSEWLVESHGTMHTSLSRRVNKGIDDAQDDCFYGGNVRSWNNNGTTVFLPSPDNDLILVFTHILEHFFIESVGLKQVCDWCRLLWTYRSELDLQLLESRIKKMGLMTVWKAFGSMAVDALGMPQEAMPMYVQDTRLKVNGFWSV